MLSVVRSSPALGSPGGVVPAAYSSSFRVSVLRSSPSRCAARVLLPLSAASTRLMYSRSSSSSVSPRATAGAEIVLAGGAALAHDGRQVLRLDQRVFGQHNRALNHVLQLAHVARPAIAQERLARRLVKPADLFSGLARDAGQKVLRQIENVLRSIAQRRQVNLHAVQAVVEILAEGAVAETRLEILVGGRHHPHGARSSRCVPAEPPDLPSCSTRRSLAWSAGASSAISSRKIVPPSASTKMPERSPRASVNAPRLWPKSSLSSSVSRGWRRS